MSPEHSIAGMYLGMGFTACVFTGTMVVLTLWGAVPRGVRVPVILAFLLSVLAPGAVGYAMATGDHALMTPTWFFAWCMATCLPVVFGIRAVFSWSHQVDREAHEYISRMGITASDLTRLTQDPRSGEGVH